MNVVEVFELYKMSCYGDKILPVSQEKEVEQAFLSGIVAAITEQKIDRADVLAQVKGRLLRLGCFSGEFN